MSPQYPGVAQGSDVAVTLNKPALVGVFICMALLLAWVNDQLQTAEDDE